MQLSKRVEGRGKIRPLRVVREERSSVESFDVAAAPAT